MLTVNLDKKMRLQNQMMAKTLYKRGRVMMMMRRARNRICAKRATKKPQKVTCFEEVKNYTEVEGKDELFDFLFKHVA